LQGWTIDLAWGRLAEILTDLFGGTEFIAPDVLFKTTNAGAQKK